MPGVWTGWHEAPADSTLRRPRRWVDPPPITADGQKAWGPPAWVAERQCGEATWAEGERGVTDGRIGRQRAHNQQRLWVKWRRRGGAAAAAQWLSAWLSAHLRDRAQDALAVLTMSLHARWCAVAGVCACAANNTHTQTFLHERAAVDCGLAWCAPGHKRSNPHTSNRRGCSDDGGGDSSSQRSSGRSSSSSSAGNVCSSMA